MAKSSFKYLSLLITLFGLSVLASACSDSKKQAAVFLPTYSLSGTVSGDIEQGVTIAVSGAVSASVPTDADGNYSVTGLPNGSYTVTPSKPGYTFTAASRSVVIGGANSSGNDFTAAAVPYSIDGTVSGATVTGVTISVTGTTEGGTPFTTSLDTTGSSYSVPGVPNGSYTVTPSKAGYSFSPVSLAVTISAGNASIAAFTSTADVTPTFDLTGTVTGDIKSGVTISVTGAASGSSVTGGDGTYTIANLPNGTYTVSASKPGYTFSADLSPTIAGADSTGNDFTATAVLYSISGAVSGDVLAGVTITVSGTTEGGASFGPVEATSSGNGTYSVADVPNGDYTVAAARPGYLLNPASYAVTISVGNATGRDFTASMNPTVALRADGGSGTVGTGGSGGGFYVESYGSVKVLNSGTVNALFTVPTITPDFGANPYVVSAGTTTVAIDDDSSVGLYTLSGDTLLYSGNGDGITTNDAAVTGLTIPDGATLVLVDQGFGYGYLFLTHDLVINGTLTSDLSSNAGLYVEANLIYVETTGKILASSQQGDTDAGEIYLGYGMGITKTIVNRGTIEAKGDGTGSGGYIYFEPDDLVVNSGTIDASGGSNGGSGGEFDAFVDYGDFYSSGTVRMNGGNGTFGGATEYDNYNWNGYSSWVETAYRDNSRGRNGDIIISGTWEAKGGDGASDNGGNGGALYFQTDAMGAITVNASMSIKGGNGGGAGSSGGSAGELVFSSYLDPNGSGAYVDPTPGTISIAGTYDLRGGNGDQGGNGGYVYVYSSGVNSSNVGSDVEFIGFPVITLNGGEGGENGGSASNGAVKLYTYAGSSTAKAITNQADIQAKGGNATVDGGTGGTGGYVEMQTGNPGDAQTVLTNSGSIDISGGNGTTGGSAYNAGFGDAIYLWAQHLENSGNLAANGGNGTTGSGGNGGNITLISDDCAMENTGTLNVAGGSPDGVEGSTSTDSCSGGGPE